MRTFAIIVALLLAPSAWAASYSTPNFAVTADSPQWAQAIGNAAEKYRKETANTWLGETLPTWAQPCAVKATFYKGNCGSTSFVFDKGEAFGWDMSIKGTPERLIDSVLRHEITHTVFASHFRQPLPRWADEGAASTVEHPSERGNWDNSIIKCLQTNRGIPFGTMFRQMEYGQDFEAVYAQGYSVVSWLIDNHGRRKFVQFLDNGLGDKNWPRAAAEVYGFKSANDMQNQWMAWISAGRPLHTATVQVAGQCGSCSGGCCQMGGCGSCGSCEMGGSCQMGGSCGSCQQCGPPQMAIPRTYRDPQATPIPAPQAPPAAPPTPSIDWAAYDAQQKAITDAQKKLTDQGDQSLVVLNDIKVAIGNQKGCQCDNSKLEAKIDALATAVANINVAQPTPPVQPIVHPPAPAPVANGAPAFFLKLRPHKEN